VVLRCACNALVTVQKGLQVSNTTDTGVSWSVAKDATDGWRNGTVTLNALNFIDKTSGCASNFTLEIKGALDISLHTSKC
jgi:hypothetical protein